VADQVLSAIINTLLAIPPIRFVMGLVESRWRPLWAALWLAVIAYLVSRTMNYWALRRARLKLLTETPDGRQLGVSDPPSPASVTGVPVRVVSAAPASETAPPPPASTAAKPQLPLAILSGALIVAAIVTGTFGMLLRSSPNEPEPQPTIAPVDSALKPEPPIDVRWRGGRADDDDCIGTFEVTRGAGTRARLAAFVMDTSGAVMARDSAQVTSAVPGVFVEFRFRHVDCEEIDDWQIQATTPGRRAP
jgi:hypothetical protein